MWFQEGCFSWVRSRRVSIEAPAPLTGASFVLCVAMVGRGHRPAAAVPAQRGLMGKVGLRLWRGSQKNRPPSPSHHRNGMFFQLLAGAHFLPPLCPPRQALAGPWCRKRSCRRQHLPLRASISPRSRLPCRDNPCCGQKRVLHCLNAKGLALLDRPALWGTQVQAP